MNSFFRELKCFFFTQAKEKNSCDKVIAGEKMGR